MTPKKFFFILLLLLSAHLLFADDKAEFEKHEINHFRSRGFVLLADDQSGEYGPNKYLIYRDIVVAKKNKLTFLPGAQIFFKKNTRIIVHGTIVCEGNSDSPVKFSKLDSSSYFTALESDNDNIWEGIFVSSSGGVAFRCAQIEFSRFGIEATDQRSSIMLDSVVFSNNSFSNLKIASNTVYLPDNQLICYPNSEYGSTIKKSEKLVLAQKNTKPKHVITNVSSPVKPIMQWKKPLLIQSTWTTIVGALLIGKYTWDTNYYNEQLTTNKNPDLFNSLKRKRDSALDQRTQSIIITSIGAVSLLFIIPLSF